jgi:lysophospholipid acyltransferase (LPLAT)-like uncharacterized protein
MGARRWLGRQGWSPKLLGVPLGWWLRFCAATSRWDRQGEAELEAALRDGPVVLALWHERIALSGLHWRPGWGPVSALHTTRFAGRVAGAAQAVLGTEPIAMSSRRGNLAASREVLRRLREGTSVGIAADGSSGPARELRDAALEWARASGRPVFVYAFAMRGQRRLGTWDRMVWPRPFSRGVAIWRRWDREVPRRLDEAAFDNLRQDLAAALTAVADEADALAGARSDQGRPPSWGRP